MYIRPHGVVHTINQYPQPELILGVAEILSNSRLEYAVCLLLEYPECQGVKGRPLPLIEGGKVETFVAKKGLISDNFDS